MLRLLLLLRMRYVYWIKGFVCAFVFFTGLFKLPLLSLSVDCACGCQTLVRVDHLSKVVPLPPQGVLPKKVYSLLHLTLFVVIAICGYNMFTLGAMAPQRKSI
jgi:hypothetical protein